MGSNCIVFLFHSNNPKISTGTLIIVAPSYILVEGHNLHGIDHH